MKTIPLHQLAAYLPYKTKVTFMYKRKRVIGTLDAVYKDGTITCGDTINASPNKFKLMLVPLDKYKPKTENEDFIYHQLKQSILYNGVKQLRYIHLQFALKHHIDIFNLIPQGLAVEKLSTTVKGME